MLAVDHIRNVIAIEQAFDKGQLAHILRAREMNHRHMRRTDGRPLLSLQKLRTVCTFLPLALDFTIG